MQINSMPKKRKKGFFAPLALFLIGFSAVFLLLPFNTNLATVQKNNLLNTLENTTSKNPILISHRGSINNKGAEHTFAGYDSAIADGSKYIELDVVLSADGVAFVSHDNNLKRIFDKKNYIISKRDSEELDEIKYPKSDEKLHRLTEVLQRYKGKVNFVIEAKHIDGEVVGQVETAISTAVKKYNLENDVILQDSRIPGANYFNLLLPDVPILFLYLNGNIPTKESVNALPDYVKIIGVDIDSKFSPEVRDAAYQRGIKYSGFSISNKKQNQKIIDQGLELFFTDNTKQTVDFLNEKNISYQ